MIIKAGCSIRQNGDQNSEGKEEPDMPRSKKSFEERIDAKDSEIQKYLEKANQLQAQKKQLEKQKKDADRKARTKRLIEIGASVESVLDREFKDGDNLRLMNFLKAQERNGKYFSKAMEKELPSEDMAETSESVS